MTRVCGVNVSEERDKISCKSHMQPCVHINAITVLWALFNFVGRYLYLTTYVFILM